ncbi:MAG: SurA N-terminal domain-containing protein [Candidatus Omnitrophica bacterium]|nr:SurA N-terminal domain-containing protein [Candidatus Omnitrophota bacterium]
MLLKFLRKRKNMKRIMWGLAILIIPAFVIWGAGTSGKNKGDKPDYAGKLFGKKVSYDDYYNMWNVARDYAVKSFGNNAPAEFINQLAWSRIILIEEAKREKLTATDREVVEKIASFQAFQRNGSFDKKLYKSMLQDTARSFEEKLRDDLLISKLKDNVTAVVNVNDEDVKNEYKKKFEKIKLSYALIHFAESEKDVQYTDPGLLDFYEKNKADFKKGEEVNIKYIEIPLSNPGAEELAYKVLDQVNLKKNLEEPAKADSLEIKETGFFSANEEIPGIGWSYEFTKAGFELEKNQINNMLVRTEKGFYIIQLKEKKGPYIPDYEKVKDSVKKAFIKEGSVKLSGEKSEKIYLDIISRVKTDEKLEDAVKEHGLQVKQTDFIGRDGYVPEIGPAEELVDTAFSVNIGGISKPLKTLLGWIIIQPLEIKPIEEAKFIEEKDKFKENLLADKKEEGFNKYFQDLQKKAGFVSYTTK